MCRLMLPFAYSLLVAAATVLDASPNFSTGGGTSSERSRPLPSPPLGPPYQHTGPLACQDNDKFPMLPTFHIIGNVTQATDGSIKLEPINDCSGVTFYKGIYHVWHQCCQNHWDHVGDSAHLSCPFRVAHRSSE